MLIAQISDLHFLPKGTLAFGRVDTAGCLERAVDHLNALDPPADAVLITGDLCNDGDAPVWAALMAQLGRLRAPILPIPGNHDDRELKRAPGQPTLVALHHPPFRTGIDHMDAMMLEDGEELAQVIGPHPQVARVLCGHVHRSVQSRFAGTLAQIGPGVAHAVRLTLVDAPSRWVQEPPGVLLHEWRDGRGLVSHLDFIGAFPLGQFSDHHTSVGEAQPGGSR